MAKNVGESVRRRLLNLARERGDDFQLVLLRYVNERLLFRLSRSAHERSFVLKGAALFTVWTGKPHRATRDLDLLGFGDPAPQRLHGILIEVLATEVEDDGVVFEPSSLAVGLIREDQEYGGVRATMQAQVTTASLRLQVDVGFGDAIAPAAEVVDFPTLLDFPAPRLRAYPRETVVSEKVEAFVQLGLANSRMKDFYDLIVLSPMFPFDGAVLVDAIRATFDNRGTPIPTTPPVALTSTFADDATKRTQWTAFVRKTGAREAGDLPSAIAEVARFVWGPLAAAATDSPWSGTWAPGGPWAPCPDTPSSRPRSSSSRSATSGWAAGSGSPMRCRGS